MKNPWFALYVSDYLAKTCHLTQGQHGAYFLLMLHYYGTGKPIPANALQVHSICRCKTDAEKQDVDEIIRLFFREKSGVYRHKRIDQELARRSSISTKRRKSASKRWQANALQKDTQLQSQRSYVEPKNGSPVHGGVFALQEQQKDLNRLIWERYSCSYRLRYKTDPVRNAKSNKNISEIGKRLGKDAPFIAEFFLSHNSSFYVENCHPVGLLLKDAEKLHTEWKSGRTVTRTQAQQIERGHERGNVFLNAGALIR